MATNLRHKRYLRVRSENEVDGSPLRAFTSVDDAKEKIGLNSTLWATGSPTITYALADSNRTLVMTIEFANVDNQTAFTTALTNAWGDVASDSTAIWTEHEWGVVEHFKTEWLDTDGSSVSATENF